MVRRERSAILTSSFDEGQKKDAKRQSHDRKLLWNKQESHNQVRKGTRCWIALRDGHESGGKGQVDESESITKAF